MKTKKKSNIDTEKHRTTFFLIGLLVALGIVVTFINMKSPIDDLNSMKSAMVDIDEENVPITRVDVEPPPEKPKTAAPEIIKLVDNDFDLEDPPDIHMGFKEDESIQIIDIDDNEKLGNTIFVNVEADPVYNGSGSYGDRGDQKLMQDIYSEVDYPTTAQENDVEGTVYIRFVVDADGKIKDAHVYRGTDPLLDEEALRVIGTLSDFTPGMQNGKKVAVWFNLPIKFKLN
ncbi:MAG: energy transducer TonB [Bacteroidota bacterium]|nr:energy transducer TonB [Bacteroidota bacterium]